MYSILDECERKGIPVHVDGAWLGCTRIFEFDLNHPAIQSYGISLSKAGIGNNRILYTWDGKSENGSQLANGVYYYRLILNGLTNNQSFKNCGELEAQLGGKLIIMN